MFVNFKIISIFRNFTQSCSNIGTCSDFGTLTLVYISYQILKLDYRNYKKIQVLLTNFNCINLILKH